MPRQYSDRCDPTYGELHAAYLHNGGRVSAVHWLIAGWVLGEIALAAFVPWLAVLGFVVAFLVANLARVVRRRAT